MANLTFSFTRDIYFHHKLYRRGVVHTFNALHVNMAESIALVKFGWVRQVR
jgi:hypothetical protein